MSLLPHLKIEPEQTARYSIIWLHGLGADGGDFAALAPQLEFQQKSQTRFIFPHAPSMPVTINGGHIMPAWYDIREMNIDRKVDIDQLQRSSDAISQLIEHEEQVGIASDKIIIAGFSQGGAVAIDTALTYPRKLAGLLVLSSYFATADEIKATDANKNLDILIQHGSNDPVVPEVLGLKAADTLKQRDYPVEYQRYPMEHSLCPPQIIAINRWFEAHLI